MAFDGLDTRWLGILATLPLLLTVPAGISSGEEVFGSQPTHSESDRREEALGAPTSASSSASVAPDTADEQLAPVPAPATAGMRVFLDPETGRVVGPAELPPQALSALEQALLRRDGEGLVQQTLPNGAVVLPLQNRFHNFAVGSLGHEGNVSTSQCVTSEDKARSLLGRVQWGSEQQASLDD